MGYNTHAMAHTTIPLEERLGPSALIQIARDYFSREKTSVTIAAEHAIHRQAVPRLAKAGKELAAKHNEAPPGDTGRG